jgi:hypothetical protein
MRILISLILERVWCFCEFKRGGNIMKKTVLFSLVLVLSVVMVVTGLGWALEKQKAPAQLVSQKQAEVKSVIPNTVSVEVGSEKTLTVSGNNLDQITKAEALLNSAPAKDVEVKLGVPSPASRQVTLKALASAKPGIYQLKFTAGTQSIVVPVNVLKLEVKAKITETAPIVQKPPTASSITQTKQDSVPKSMETPQTGPAKSAVQSSVPQVDTKTPDISQTAAQAEQTAGKIQEMQSRTKTDQQKPDLPSVSIDPSLTSGPGGNTDGKKPSLDDALSQKGNNPLTTGSKNPNISKTSSTLEGIRDQSKPQSTTSTQGQLLGREKTNFDRSWQGANSQLGITVKEVVGEIAKRLGSGGKDGSGGTGSGGGVRGYCEETSTICNATGKTWDKLTSQEKKFICDGVRKETDKVKGSSAEGSVSANDCESSLKEPNWEKIMGARLDPLIHTTEDQGRKGDAQTNLPIQPKVNKIDLKQTLVDPGKPEVGTHPSLPGVTPDSGKPTPNPDGAGSNPN